MRQIITIDYRDFLIPEGIEFAGLTTLIAQLIPINKKGYGNEAIYCPEEGNPTIEVKFIQDNQIRPQTEEESLKDEIKDLKSTKSYQEDVIEELQKKVKELECINSSLCEEKESSNALQEQKTT